MVVSGVGSSLPRAHLRLPKFSRPSLAYCHNFSPAPPLFRLSRRNKTPAHNAQIGALHTACATGQACALPPAAINPLLPAIPAGTALPQRGTGSCKHTPIHSAHDIDIDIDIDINIHHLACRSQCLRRRDSRPRDNRLRASRGLGRRPWLP
jgi:hypothetical protein